MMKAAEFFAIAWMVALREVRSRYLGSLIGYFWIVLQPVMYSIGFVVIRSFIAEPRATDSDVHPILFVFVGVLVFQVWYEAIQTQNEFMHRAVVFMKSIPIRPEVFALSSMLVSVVDALIRIVFAVLAILLFQPDLMDRFYLFPIIVLMIVASGNLLGYVLSVFGSFYKDVGKFLSSFSIAALLLSPVFYKATSDTSSGLFLLQASNPVASGLAFMRDTLWGGEPGFGSVFLITLLILSLLGVVAWRFYSKTYLLVVERL